MLVETKKLSPLCWMALLAALALALGLATARGAAARPAPGPGTPLVSPIVEEDEDEEDGDELEEVDNSCESEDEAAEEACEEREEREEEEAEEAEEAAECRVEDAEATVAALPARNQLRLTVRYRAYRPSAVAIDLRLRGGKGSLDLGVANAHVGRRGTIHTSETLSDAEMTRALAAKEFAVGIRAVDAPRSCRDLLDRHLTSRHGLTWSDPLAARRAHEDARPY